MTLRKYAAVMLSASLLFTIAIYFALEAPRLAHLRLAAQATPVREASAAPLPFDVVTHRLTDEHRALEAAQLAAVGGSRLKAFYLDCARETSARRMGVDEAVYCQAVADALLHGHFDGDFERLIEWWRQQPAEPDHPGTAAAGA